MSIKTKKKFQSLSASILSLLITSPTYADTQFSEVSNSLGIALTTDNGDTGFGWIDFDNDGDLDLYLSQGTDNRLYKNRLTETGIADYIETNISNSPLTGLDSKALVGDYDGNGCDDIFSGTILLRNNYCDAGFDINTDSLFTDVTSSSFIGSQPQRGRASAFGDIDNDGDLDLYVSYQGANSSPNELYINNNGIFTRRTNTDTDDTNATLAVTFTDYDNDGDLDILVANDTFTCDLNDTNCVLLGSEIYKNNLIESGNLAFEAIGFGINIAAMSIAIGDYNNDGTLDYYQSDIGHGALTTGNSSSTPGLADTIKLIDPADVTDRFSGWGAAFFDANNDGFEDLFRANKFVNGVGIGGVNSFFLNNADSTFTQMTAAAGLTGTNGRGQRLAIADYDNDGRVDTVTGGSTGINLYKNISTPENWIKFNLIGNNPNHRGIGAKVFITSTSASAPASIRKQMRETRAGSSYGASTNDYRAHFGLGTHDTINSALIKWPNGCEQSVKVSTLNQIINVAESNCTNIFGKVTAVDGSPLDNLNISISTQNGRVFTTATNCNGDYRIELNPAAYYTEVRSGDYTDLPSGFFTLLREGTNQQANFVETPILPAIVGTVTSDTGTALAGITVKASTASRNNARETTTDCRGNYRMALTSDAYYAEAINSDYIFNPLGRLIFLNTDSEVSSTFTGTPVQ